jgi:hypothetical protein
VSTRRVTIIAAHTARSIRRRLASAAGREPDRRGNPHTASTARVVISVPRGLRPLPDGPPPESLADDAELDELRGELVRELDRMAARDESCSSASFRRI